MKNLLPLLLLTASLAGCQRGATTSPGPESTLLGSWRLTGYQCHCPPNQPVPDESVTFGAGQHFKLYRNQALAAEGTYTTGQGASCGGTPEPIITLTPTAASTYAPKGAYTLEGNTLVIDQCSAADGPRYTYTRQ
ncbi:hypothetical protein [Hymenobacter cheonanensis]|uniref:hypothetical protein n=1 Tax=Hymenobacter sp. CA2-7 TaxID=3063993 RepID=UPI002712B363|nr:hypothetical protein [Hymenobacter sp. CA2-7]MDO7887896.1 hypothetical protein [Hymenobacter sp. CA2-7]